MTNGVGGEEHWEGEGGEGLVKKFWKGEGGEGLVKKF
jgi:hypothetical protein